MRRRSLRSRDSHSRWRSSRCCFGVIPLFQYLQINIEELCKSCYESIFYYLPTPKHVNTGLWDSHGGQWYGTNLYLCLVVNWSLCFSLGVYGRSPPPEAPPGLPLAGRAPSSASSRGSWAGPGSRPCHSRSPRPPPCSHNCHSDPGGHPHDCLA